jgi:hypothetical protein
VAVVFLLLLAWRREVAVKCRLGTLGRTLLHLRLHLRLCHEFGLGTVALVVGDDLGICVDLLLLLLFLQAHYYADDDEEANGEDGDDYADNGTDGELLLSRRVSITVICGSATASAAASSCVRVTVVCGDGGIKTGSESR